MHARAFAVLVPALLLTACGAGPIDSALCTDPTVSILTPAAEAHLPVYTTVDFTATKSPMECSGSFLWSVNGAHSQSSPFQFPAGRFQIQVDFSDAGRGLASDTRFVWGVLPTELLYDEQESSVWRTDGAADIRVTDDGSSPAWSPDGSLIAFVRFDGADDEIWTINANGSITTERRITDNAVDDYAPAWSPDGLKLAFVTEAGGDGEVCTLIVATKAVQACTSNLHDDQEPDWKGNLIAFHANPGGLDYEIFTIRDDLVPAPTPVTSNSLHDNDPRWSSDGTKIVFSRATANGPHDVWLWDSNGNTQTNLTPNSDNYHDHEPAISPDGRMIAFVSNRSGSVRLWLSRMSLGEFPVPQLTPPANARHPRWKP